MTSDNESEPSLKKGIIRLFLLKVRFAMSSLVATLADYVLYLVLVTYFLTPVVSNIISAFTGMVINFLLQKRFVFRLRRSVVMAFSLSLLVSIGGISLSTFIIWFLNKYAFFSSYQFITKLCATGIVFFYNFYLKRFAFEKRFFEWTVDQQT